MVQRGPTPVSRSCLAVMHRKCSFEYHCCSESLIGYPWDTPTYCSIWIEAVQKPFRKNHANAGPVPELRALFYRLVKLAKMPVSVLFVFDGPLRPPIKRGRRVVNNVHWLIPEFKTMIVAFGFEILDVRIRLIVHLARTRLCSQDHQAAGEAEAELARLNQTGVIKAVISEDVDTLVFGARTVIRMYVFLPLVRL